MRCRWDLPERQCLRAAAGRAVTGALLVKLTDPVYPRLARVARITGTVDVEVRVRQDGTIESTNVLSGHPMLRESALDSAQKSQFECRGCDVVSPYRLAYTFRLVPPDLTKDCKWTDEELNAHSVEADAGRGRVTVTAVAMYTCDPAVQLRRVRSLKCLYLWRCGVREIEIPGSR